MREDVLSEYARWVRQIGPEDPYRTQHCLGILDVLWAHFCLVDFFIESGEGIGGVGPRSLDLLHSSLLRQHFSYGGRAKWIDEFDIVSTLFFGLIMDHPFHDVNKRTAFLSCLFHLESLGKCLTLNHKQFEDFTVEIADRRLSRYSRYRELINSKTHDPEVRFISFFLRKHTRHIDNRYYAVTYRQFKGLLNKFGYDLSNPRHNHIDVVRIEERRKILGFGPKESTQVRVCQIGFPNWTAQVGKGAIKTARKSCRLTDEHGVDSQTFFKDADPIDRLIARYQEPLRNLAKR
jgi:prophage maintenance system killer protein